MPKYCRTGVIFADLLNKINGREEVIKGVYRIVHNERNLLNI